MPFFGSLINSAVKATSGGLKGQNEGDDKLYERHRKEKEDRRDEEHFQTDYLLRKYATERQSRAEERQGRHDERTEEHYRNQDRPEWQRQGYPDFNSWDADTHEPMPDRDHTDRRPTWAKEGYPSFEEWRKDQTSERGEGGNDTRRALTSIERQVDDTRADLGRVERATPELSMVGYDTPADSIARVSLRQSYLERARKLQERADSLDTVRDSLVAASLNGGEGPPSSSSPSVHTGPAADLPITGGPSPDRPLGHAARPGPTPDAANPQLSAALHDLQTQYQAALAWRGPNGEKKDPIALQKRYLEVLAQIQAGGRP